MIVLCIAVTFCFIFDSLQFISLSIECYLLNVLYAFTLWLSIEKGMTTLYKKYAFQHSSASATTGCPQYNIPEMGIEVVLSAVLSEKYDKHNAILDLHQLWY